jgi:SAM-dependent methyltransferase
MSAATPLRERFNEDAELYDRVRPGYPAELFDQLARTAQLEAGARVLEIGCGTGQATMPLAERGCSVVAVELGPAMAAVARRKLARWPRVEVINAAFEDWPLPAEPFDLVVAATAFHWLDPTVRVSKTADALRPGGALAIVATEHIAGGTQPFFAEMQACYERWDPSTPPGLRLLRADQISTESDELDRSGRFEPAVLFRYEWEQTYSTAAYLDVLGTYSGHRALQPDLRARLLDCIAELIERRYNGAITKRYLNELRVARLRPQPMPPE